MAVPRQIALSDSEFESVFGDASSATISARKTTKKRKATPIRSRSDSESETTPTSSLTLPKKKPAAKSRACATAKSSKDLFGLLSEDDESFALENSHRRSVTAQKLGSSLTTKVANGVVRRAADFQGAYYVEVRVYSTSDALKSPPEQRYKKALVTLKAQLNTESREWRDLQKFMKNTKLLFGDTEPMFYSNKISFK